MPSKPAEIQIKVCFSEKYYLKINNAFSCLVVGNSDFYSLTGTFTRSFVFGSCRPLKWTLDILVSLQLWDDYPRLCMVGADVKPQSYYYMYSHLKNLT